MKQTSELELAVLRTVKIYPDLTAYDIAKIVGMQSMGAVLRILESLAEQRLIRNVDKQNEIHVRSIWRSN